MTSKYPPHLSLYLFLSLSICLSLSPSTAFLPRLISTFVSPVSFSVLPSVFLFISPTHSSYILPGTFPGIFPGIFPVYYPVPAVSNAGGYHSTKDYFKNNNDNSAVQKITEIAQTAVQIVENIDYSRSIKNDENENSTNILRSFDYDINQEESWVST